LAAQKNQQLPRDLKERLFEYAHDRRTSMSDVVAGVVDKIANGQSTPPPSRERVDMVDMKYSPPANYSIAMERARAEGVSLQSWVTLELVRIMGEQ
jgi:hypothetical protein